MNIEEISADKLIDQIPGGIGIFRVKDERDKIEALYINEAAGQLLGRGAEELKEILNRDCMSLIFQKDRVRMQQELRRFFKKTENFNICIRMLHKDGIPKWVKITGNCCGKKTGYSIFCVVFTDISHEKEREKELISQKGRLRERLKRDLMTGLYNREGMVRVINSCFEENSGECAAFFMIDIDNFKQINDTYGHVQGDAALETIADKLKSVFRGDDYIGRMGGDEFAVFIQGNFTKDVILKKAETLCRTLDFVWRSGEVHMPVTCSVGIALAPQHGRDYQTLYRHADAAQYEAKLSGKNRVKIYGDFDVLENPYRKIIQAEEHSEMEDIGRDDLERVKTFLHTIPAGIGVFEIGDAVHILYCNEKARGLCGYKAGEMRRDLRDNIMEIMYHEDRIALEAAIKTALKDGGDISGIYRIFHKSGRMVWLQISGILAGYHQGNPIFYAAFLDVTLSRNRMEYLRHKAEHDSLTGVYNSEKFFAEAARILRENTDEQYILLRVDIYRFKIINEIFGRKIGDKILVSVAQQLRMKMPESGVYGRLGGDDFVVLMPKRSLDVSQFQNNARNLKDIMDIDFNIVTYIGIYEVKNRDELVERMCDRAQMALQTIKGDYLVHYAFYKDSLRREIISEQEVLKDMVTILDNEELQVYYQPIYNVSAREIVGAEALVRWMHPEKGLLPPNTFIPLFEKNGFILEMDRYVRKKVCEYLFARKKQGKKIVPVSVNVSRITLYNRNFPNEIEDLVAAYDLKPKYLKLEITESAYMDDSEQLMQVCVQLRERGFQVLMDDFGTGYSSLNMLKDVPADVLKLDRSFVMDIGKSERAEQVIKIIINTAKILGMRVVAEGVECEEQYSFLKTAGCTGIQGFYFSKPVPQDDFTKIMEN